MDGFRERGFLGGSKKGLEKPIIKESKIIPGEKGLLPEKPVVCPPRHCLQTQQFIPQECRRPQFFTHNGIQCPDCDIDICVGGGPLTPGGGGVWGDGLGPRGPFGPRRTIPGDLGWQGRFDSDIPLVPGGIDSQINGGLFPDPQFGGRFGQGGLNGDFGGFDQFGIQNGGQFGPSFNSGRNGLVNRLNAGFGDFDPSWNTGNVGNFGNSWNDNTLPLNRRSSFV